MEFSAASRRGFVLGEIKPLTITSRITRLKWYKVCDISVISNAFESIIVKKNANTINLETPVFFFYIIIIKNILVMVTFSKYE